MASRASAEIRGRADAAIAIFDLDGTLTRSDTLLPYIAGFLAARPARWTRLPAVAVALFAYLIGLLDRDACKERIIRSCLGGASRAELAAYTERFVKRLLDRGMHRDALAALEAHRAHGAHLILLSASPDVYVPAIAARLGFQECVCTELSWSAERLVGAFATPNRRAEEKSAVVRALRQRLPGRMAAYANSSSDLPHLELTDQPLLVNGSAAARRAALARGIPCEPWR